MGDVWDSIKSGTDSLTGKIFGGDTHPIDSANFSAQTDEEKARLQDIEAKIEALFGEQGPLKNIASTQNADIQSLFANNLKTFLTNGGQNTPEDIKRASDFVDQTFTNPTQKVVDQNVADYGDQAAGRAAALGRNPNADIATQQAIAGEGIRQNIGLRAERGSRIQQATDNQYTRTIGSLNSGLQGSGYLNGLAQQAFGNQLALLNGRTGLAGIYQNERGQKGIGTTSSPGLLGYVDSTANTVGNIGKAVGSLKGLG